MAFLVAGHAELAALSPRMLGVRTGMSNQFSFLRRVFVYKWFRRPSLPFLWFWCVLYLPVEVGCNDGA